MLTVPGGSLALTVTEPANQSARASVIINCAMGVKQSFYRPFAQFLASRGFVVTTWDYRGVGESKMDGEAARHVSLTDWSQGDLSLVIAATASARVDLPIAVVGHSFGGHIIALPENCGKIKAAVVIACPSGYVGHWRGQKGHKFMWALAYLGLPILTRLFGRFPASRLRLGADLPRRAALQWGGLLRHPRYIGATTESLHKIARFSAPIHAVSFTDDEFAPAGAIDAMLALYKSSRVSRESVSPRDHDREVIGHMGFFRPRPSNGMWSLASDRLDELLGGGPAPR